MIDYVPNDFTVKVNNHGHRDDIAACEDHPDKHVVIKRVGQVVKGAGGQVAL